MSNSNEEDSSKLIKSNNDFDFKNPDNEDADDSWNVNGNKPTAVELEAQKTWEDKEDEIYTAASKNRYSSFHHNARASYHTSIYGLVPMNERGVKTASTRYSVLTTGNYKYGLDRPYVILNDDVEINVNEEDELNEQQGESSNESNKPLNKYSVYISESKVLVKYSIPIIISEVLRNSLLLMPIVFVGHRSSYELAAITLGNTYCNVTGWSLLIGLDSAIDTLCSQAYAAAKTIEDRKLVGKILQRGFVILVCFCFLIYILWEFTEPILLLFHQDPGIAELSGKFTKFERLNLIPYVLFECIKKLLLIQGFLFVPTFIILAALPVSASLHYFFIFSSYSPVPKDIAYIGSPISTTITFSFMCILGILYIKFIRGKECWGGIDLKSIFKMKYWKEFLKLGIPGAFMVSNEWWAYEVCSLYAGLLGDKQLAIQSIFSAITNYCYNIPMGLSMATTLRIGNNLGEKNSEKAKSTSKIALLMALIIGTFNSLIIFIFKGQLPKIFTNSENVISGCSQILIIGAIYQLSDGIAAVGIGVLRGSGHQQMGAYVNFVGYWIIGVPLSTIFCFVFKWNLNGIWIGMATALISVSLFQLFNICRIDWKKEVANTEERILNN